MSFLTPSSLSRTLSAEHLNVAEIEALVARAAAADAVETPYGTQYRATPDSERALSDLAAAVLPLLVSAISGAKAFQTHSGIADYDEADGVAWESLVVAVRTYDPAKGNFLPYLRRVVRDALHEAGHEASATVTIPAATLTKYWRARAAYPDLSAPEIAAALERDSRGSQSVISAQTFLDVHAVISENPSLADAEASGATPVVHDGVAHLVDSITVAGLLAELPAESEQICRLAYGFDDPDTDALRAEHGFHSGEILSDLEISELVHLGRKTAQRRRVAALASMRATLEADFADADAEEAAEAA